MNPSYVSFDNPCQDTFVREFKNTPEASHARHHDSAQHKLPVEFNRIRKPYSVKPWQSLTDDSILQAVASWHWVHEFFRTHRATGGIGGYKMSKLMLTLMIVRRISSNVVYASMGNHVFAAIGLRLHECVVDGTAIFKFSTSHKECEFVYVTDPSDWVAIPWIATRFADHGIVMQQCGDALPLVRHTLRQAEHTLTDVDIQQCTEILKLAPKDTIKGNF